ncbi:MAG: malonyl-ACP O-methyltransferase BioC [Candidatus Competibacteraceae bacterium]
MQPILNSPPILPAKQRIRQAFNQVATTYDTAAEVQREVSDRLAAHLIQISGNLNPKAILDAGGGTGYGAQQLQLQWPDAEMTMIDFAPRMLIAARTQLTEAALICADIEHLPVADQCFELYWSSLAWQWNDPHRCLAEARRVLKPGGALAVATLGANNFPELRHAFATLDDYRHVLTIPAPEHLLTACQASNCEVWRWDRQPVRRYFPDLRTLLRSVKAVGAREVEQRRPTPFSRSTWHALTARYETLREPAGLPLTYDAVWLIAIRP